MNDKRVVIIKGKLYQHMRDDLYAPLSFQPVAGGVLRQLGPVTTLEQILDEKGEWCDLTDVKGERLLKRWEEGR